MAENINEKDWDRAGVMPHTVMGLNKLLPDLGKGVAGAAGAAALAGAGAIKGAKYLGKQAFMKSGMEKVLKRIGELEDYIITGDHAEKFKYRVSIGNGKSISSIKTYDEIRNKIIEEIVKDTNEFRDVKNSLSKGSTRYNLNDKATLVNTINKYHKFFSVVNKNFEQVRTSPGEGEDIYNELQNTVKTNITYGENYVNHLIESFKQKFQISKDENSTSNRRIQKYIMVLKEAWENAKKNILQKYKKLAIDICRSAEFTALYKLVESLYQKLPNGKMAAKDILNTWHGNLMHQISPTGSPVQLKYKLDASVATLVIIEKNTSPNDMIIPVIKDPTILDNAVTQYNKTNKTSYSVDDSNYNIVILDDNGRERGEFENGSAPNTLSKNVAYFIGRGGAVDDNWMNTHVRIKCTLKLGTNYGEYGGSGARYVENISWTK